jgi:hypothetical protein
MVAGLKAVEEVVEFRGILICRQKFKTFLGMQKSGGF